MILLIGSIYFSVLRKLNFTRAKACHDTFQYFNLRQLWTIYNRFGQFIIDLDNSQKNYGTQQKINTIAMYIDSILFIEATFVNITFQSSKQEDLIDTISVRLNNTRETRSNSR